MQVRCECLREIRAIFVQQFLKAGYVRALLGQVQHELRERFVAEAQVIVQLRGHLAHHAKASKLICGHRYTGDIEAISRVLNEQRAYRPKDAQALWIESTRARENTSIRIPSRLDDSCANKYKHKTHVVDCISSSFRDGNHARTRASRLFPSKLVEAARQGNYAMHRTKMHYNLPVDALTS
jgi:hypothetical protein